MFRFGLLCILIFFSCRITMAASCTQLCLHCRRLLCSTTVASTRLYSTQLRHCTTVTGLLTRILNGSPVIWGNHTTTPARQRWKQQMFCSSYSSTTHATEAKELSRADVVTIRDAAPVTESQISLGKYWWRVVTRKTLFTLRNN